MRWAFDSKHQSLIAQALHEKAREDRKRADEMRKLSDELLAEGPGIIPNKNQGNHYKRLADTFEQQANDLSKLGEDVDCLDAFAD